MVKSNGYSKTEDLGPIMAGKVTLPNFEEMDLSAGVSVIASGATLEGYPGNAKVPGDTMMSPQWARYFLNQTQGGRYDGTGYVMLWGGGKGRIGTFAICKHEFKMGPGANPMRGWHPGHCTKCGLDMTVDSGD